MTDPAASSSSLLPLGSFHYLAQLARHGSNGNLHGPIHWKPHFLVMELRGWREQRIPEPDPRLQRCGKLHGHAQGHQRGRLQQPVSQTVTVTNAPLAFFTYTPSAPVSAGSVAFTDTSTGTPTAWSWTFGDGSTSALKNPNHIYASPGTFTATLTAKNANGSTSASRTITVAPEVSATGYDMTLTLSDGAQSTTLAFDGLAMMTGNLDAQSFFPPGKVADYTGFQYLRDTDPDNMGHDTDFLTRVANNVIYILTDDQMTQLVTLASAQLDNVNLYAYERFSLMEGVSPHPRRRYSLRLDGPESRRGQTGFGESLSDRRSVSLRPGDALCEHLQLHELHADSRTWRR